MFLVATVAAALGIGVRATFGAHVAVDEPQYLMTALSLATDHDLDIADELAAGRWRAFSDVELPVQTQARPDGTEISPHDVLLPVLLAVPMGLGGWIAAKLTLAVSAGLLAALVLWTAVRRFGVEPRLAATGVAIAFTSTPFAVYGQQVYPELPAALAVTAALALLTAPAPALAPGLAAGLGPASRGWQGALVPGGLVLAITALPWLGVKYAPVAAMLAALALIRLRRSRAGVVLAAGLASMGAAYLLVHRLVWGGWTVYASGDHFQSSGEFGAVGFHPDYPGRALRLVGLLVDRGFGIAAWQPAWLLLLPALAALVRLRPRGWPALVLPLLAGWLTATFVALTMHGFWWPGRQLVVVLPLALLVILVALDRLPAAVRVAGLVLAISGVAAYAWLLADGYAHRLSWVVGFEHVGYPGYRLLRAALPDYRGSAAWPGFWPLHLAWIAVFVLLAAAGARAAGTRAAGTAGPEPLAVRPYRSEGIRP